MLYNMDFDMCSVIIYLFTLYCIIYKKGVTKSQNRVFVILVADGFFAAIFEIFASVGNSYVDSYPIVVRSILSYSFLILHNAMPLIFCIYVVMASGVSLRKTKSWFYLILVPFGVFIVVLLLNPFLNWVFYYNEDLLYTRGFMVHFLYAMAFLYVGIGIFYIIRYRKALQNNNFISMMIFVVCSVVSIIIQMFVKTLLIELFFQSLALLGILFTTENKDEILNSTTGIYNRHEFVTQNIKAIETGTDYAVVSIKFTNLKYFIQSLGVVRINEIIKEIASWLNMLIPFVNVYDCENGVFAFIIYYNIDSKIKEITNLVYQRMCNDWQSKDIDIALNTQICAVKIPEQADTLEKLLSLIDNDYIVVENKISVLTEDDIKYMQREIQIEKAIRKALERKAFKVFYQPIWDKKSNTIHSAEALIRLVDDEIGNISPEEFIPVSEKNGTIVKIGAFVFEEVCRLFSEKHIEKLGIEFVEVNLSTVQCMQRNLALIFNDIMKKYDIEASRINLEITESAAVNSTEMFMLTMQQLKKMGFTFSMDDYGTGYSNYSYMFDLDFEIIKLDKSILWNADKNTNARIILKNTILMLKEMNFRIVMEGVETEEHKKYVTGLGVDYCQGYYFSRPVPEDKFIEYCRQYNNIETALS